MARPDDIADDVWDAACAVVDAILEKRHIIIDGDGIQVTFGAAEEIARAIMAEREAQRERDARIAEERLRRSLAEMPTEGDDYWQGSGAAAQVIANKIRGAL